MYELEDSIIGNFEYCDWKGNVCASSVLLLLLLLLFRQYG
jgi:hypothetical protein